VTLEEAMQMSLGDGPLSAADSANAKIAAVLSFFIPGAGQVVLGDYIKGAAYFFAWLIMLLWLSLAHNQWHDLVDSLAGKKSGFNPVVLVPIIGSLGISIAAAFTCKKPGSGGPMAPTKKVKGPRPTPPVDLPFE
jgi:TM2 domain-containing membrane protein YozV